ncbi:ABC transporter ATP-binding protein [Bacillus sp. FSL K6-3431]|uniref:ABC transporter ATP-binding protein n=1 Tax=Bacillus sp. FSL K6-3431 TaxID=2921500 RepID=UPI0030F685E7
MYMLDILPSHIKNTISGSLQLVAKTDVDEMGTFIEQWLIITETGISVLGQEGEVIKNLLFSEVQGARTISSIGCGNLIIESTTGPIVFLRYTAGLSGKFSIVANVIEKWCKGEDLPSISEKDLPRNCPICNRRLQEGTNVCPLCIDKKKVITRILQYATPYKGQMVLAALLMIIVTLIGLAPPFITKVIVDDVLQARNMGSILLLLVVAIGATQFISALTTALRGYVGVRIGSNIMGDIRKDTYQSLIGLSLSYFDRRQTSQFIGRVNSDAEAIRQFLTDGVMYIFGQVLMFIAILAMLLSLNWQLALWALLPTPLIILTSFIIRPYVRTRWYRQWRAINKLNQIVGDSLQGFRVVKAFGQERKETDRYMDGSTKLVKETIKTEGLWQGIFPLLSFITGSSTLLIWYFGGWGVINETITLGTLMAFISYLGMLMAPLQWFSQAINWMNSAFSAADRIFEVIDAPNDVPNSPNATSLPRIEGHVRLNHVTFGYESHEPALKNVDLSVKPGEMIGLVGHSGAGKSTLINLICRFYDPNQGSITIDGIDLRNIEQEDLHKQIGVVLQETFLFDGTIAENIAYSKPDASPEEIIRATTIANAHDFIVEMTDGYDTMVGERGHRLSGGQKQRIAIARAILHDPRILILDEATASVDTETERKIQEAISRLVKGRTTFAIAHRLSTLRNADRLVVIDKGKMIESGTHEELIALRGKYHELVEAQKELSKIKGVVS